MDSLHERVAKLTHGQLVDLVERLYSHSSTGCAQVSEFLTRAEAPMPAAGGWLIKVELDNLDWTTVPLADVREYQARGMTEWEAVQAAHNLRHGKYTGQVAYYNLDEPVGGDGEPIEAEADGQARDPDQG